MKIKIIAILLLAAMLTMTFSGCVTSTNVHFETDEPGATIYVDGEKVGTSPTRVKMSNAIWENPDIIIKKEGYKDLYVGIDKEVKGVNLVCGIILWWPSLLWVYGPEKNQHFSLIPEND